MAAPMKKPGVLVYPTHHDCSLRGLTEEYLDMLRPYFQIFRSKDVENSTEPCTEIEGVTALSKVSVDFIKQHQAKLPNLKIASAFGVGVDHIPVAEMNDRGVRVSNCPDVLSDATADMTIALMLATARNFIQGVKMAMGPDPVTQFPLHYLGTDVSGATLGIVGLGRIGQQVAQRAKGFNMKILYHNRNRVATDKETSCGALYHATLHSMLPLCDFVVLTCPLTPQTTHLIGEGEFRLMKKSAIIINVARGKVIDHDALVSALTSGEIHGAGLDVTDPEPLPREHPLLKLDNVVITPHFGSQTRETRRKMFQLVVDNLKAVIIDGNDPSTEVKSN